MRTVILLPLMLMMCSGCVRTAVGVVTAPVRVGARVVDMTTTSRAEADRNRGRKLRHAERRAKHACSSAGSSSARRDCVRAKLMDQGFF